MLRGMAQMDLKQRLKANRALSVTMSFLALVGWGGFAYSAGSSSVATRDLRAELAQSTAAQDQLRAERDQHQAAGGGVRGTHPRRRSGMWLRSSQTSRPPVGTSIPWQKTGPEPRRKPPLFSR